MSKFWCSICGGEYDKTDIGDEAGHDLICKYCVSEIKNEDKPEDLMPLKDLK